MHARTIYGCLERARNAYLVILFRCYSNPGDAQTSANRYSTQRVHTRVEPARLRKRFDDLATGGLLFLMLIRETVDKGSFNEKARLPYQLRLDDFAIAMQDVYDFFFDVNKLLLERGLHRLDDMLRPAAMSGMISDMLTASMAKHARSLVENKHFNGHPDLIVQGRYANNSVKAGTDGVEIKSTRKRGGAVDTHGAREQDMCVFVYVTDHETEPAIDRRPMRFMEVYIGHVVEDDFRKNPRGDLGTRTATLDRAGIQKLRSNWIYLVKE